MATVYLADDLRHERKVALKVLKPELAAVVGAERFLAEIKTTANLQHPQILPLHDSGEADGLLFFVMPYVRGESLRDRLDREHQLPVDEAVGIAAAVAGALDYAHQHGVVHRDVKPANILMQAGQPVVCDFGIALAVGAAGGARITETGLSVGTPYYMSPEQATGDVAVGAQSDIYALGCVLYEMLTGEPPYTGKTAQAVLGGIIQGVPVSATAMRTSVLPNVDAAIRRALEKLPADRFPAARDFAAALADPSFQHGEASGEVSGRGAAMWKRTASALGALLALALGWTVLRPAPAPPVVRYGIEFAPGQEPMDVFLPTLALAPDGSAIVYVGPGGDAGQLWLKPRDRFEATPLAGTDGARSPSVSPDGTTIMYQAGRQLRRIPVLGGASVTMADSVNTTGNMPVAWLDDGTVIYVDSSWRFRRMPAEVQRDGQGRGLRTSLPGRRRREVQVSTEGGTSPLWAHSGRELFYVSPDRELVATQIGSDQTFRVGERRVLFRLDEGHVLPGISAGMYDIAPDDERFLFVRQAGSGGENVNRTILVENWFEELRAAVGR